MQAEVQKMNSRIEEEKKILKAVGLFDCWLHEWEKAVKECEQNVLDSERPVQYNDQTGGADDLKT